MIPSDQFVFFYNEIFKFLEHQGPDALKRYYKRVADRQAMFTLERFKRDGYKGMYDYWERIRIEENCLREHTYDEHHYESHMLRCPSLSKALESDAGACRVYCDHCPGWVLDVMTRAGFYQVFNMISRTKPECRSFMSKEPERVAAKYREWKSEYGEDVLRTNLPAKYLEA